ncbi:MAG: efflux RND transporter permease subunit [Delftia sp.]|nr:efflux RND transporter permease subunit [Delftia sp.]
MMQRLAAALIARPVGVLLAVLAVVALGLVSLGRMPLAAMPDVLRPTLRVLGEAPGASMETIEAGLARDLEARLRGLPGCDRVTTWSSDGKIAAEVAFAWGINSGSARIRVVEAVQGLRVGQTPVPWQVMRALAGGPQVVLEVTGALAEQERTAIAEEVLLPALAAMTGVDQVQVWGGSRQRTVVRPDCQRLSALGLGLGEVRTALARGLANRRLGNAMVEGQRVAIVAEGSGNDPRKLARLALPRAAASGLTVGDVAAVEQVGWPDHGVFRVNGRSSVGLAIHLAPGANALTVARDLDQTLQDLAPRLPEGLEVEPLVDTLALLAAAVRGLLFAALTGALLAGATLALFVRRVGPLLSLVLVIPVSLGAAAAALHGLGFSLNLVSLLGMALAVGMLVDAGVVVLDACSRAPGPGPERALTGVSTVARAIIASAFTTAVVMLPALYLRQLSAVVFRQLAVALMITLLASLAISLIALPVVAARLAPARSLDEDRLTRLYRRTLAPLMGGGWVAVILVAAAIAATVAVLGRLPQQLLAPETTAASEIELTLPAIGDPTDLAATSDLLGRLLAPLLDPEEPHLLTLGLDAASGPPLPAGRIRLTRARSRPEFQQLQSALAMAKPGLAVSQASLTGGVLASLPLRHLAVEVAGLERAAVEAEAARLGALFAAAGHPALADRPPPATVLEARPTALGETLGDRLIPALAATLPAVEPLAHQDLRLAESWPATGDLFGLSVTVPDHGTYSLGSLVNLVPVTRSALLVRHQGRAAVRLDLGDALAEISTLEEILASATSATPTGVMVTPAGGFQDWREARHELIFAALLGLVLVFLVLAALYESFRVPVVVFAVVPFAMLGGAAALALAGRGLDLASGLGFVLLIGLCVNNAVLLIDRLRDAAGDPEEWSRRAAPRLRPVVVTTLTTLATLLPVALSSGAGVSLRTTLALTTLAGLAVSTPAALYILPPLARLILRSRE